MSHPITAQDTFAPDFDAQNQSQSPTAVEETLQVESAIAEFEAQFKSTVMEGEPFYGRSNFHEYDPIIDEWLDAFDEGLASTPFAFALYRLPQAKDIHLILASSMQEHKDWGLINSASGFTLMPFEIGEPCFPFTIPVEQHYVGLNETLAGLKLWRKQHESDGLSKDCQLSTCDVSKVSDESTSTNAAFATQQSQIESGLADGVAHEAAGVANKTAEGKDARTADGDDKATDGQWAQTSLQQQRTNYHERFAKVQAALHDGRCSKLVLAREAGYHYATYSIAECFLHACELYPNAMVYLARTPQGKLWLGATPELFVKGQRHYSMPAAKAKVTAEQTPDKAVDQSKTQRNAKGMDQNQVLGQSQSQVQFDFAQVDPLSHSLWHTMSLAGTMPLIDGQVPSLDQWSDKNRHEQAIVTEFLTTTLEPWCSQLNLDGPRPIRAGNISHLRTDVSFMLQDETKLHTVLERLHPTPAVCGMPKDTAYDIIRECEGRHREYYGGSVGLINVAEELVLDCLNPTAMTQDNCSVQASQATKTDSSLAQYIAATQAQTQAQTNTKDTEHSTNTALVYHTQMFVNLRCMQLINQNYAICYAGGGILPESDECSEFIETQRKMETMRNLIEHPKYGAGSNL